MKYLMNLLLTLVAWGAGITPRQRHMTYDAAAPANTQAIKFRMNAGFPGDVNRTHPFSVEPCLQDDVAPCLLYGQILTIDATGNAVRKLLAADQSDAVSLMCWGMSVRPFPIQQSTGGMTSDFGAAVPPVTGVIDVLRQGYGMAVLNDVTALPKKGDAVYVWAVATSGVHIQGGIEAVFSSTNTVKLANAVFNGAGDASGNVEIIIGDRRFL